VAPSVSHSLSLSLCLFLSSDPETFGSPLGVLSFVLVLVLTPVWGDVHFYFTHR
jgi:hypothetical protein